MKSLKIIFTALILFSNQLLFADSPLTSTQFSSAYSSELIVAIASKSEGKLTEELMEYLIGENAIVLKMAVINELGWKFEGKSNKSTFFDYLQNKKKYKNIEDFSKKASADELLCMAYIMALDNYFKVDEAIEMADKALAKNSKSYTYQIINALIKAQKAFDSSWCTVYRLTNDIRLNEKLNKDMNDEAIKIIFDYMDLYKADCK